MFSKLQHLPIPGLNICTYNKTQTATCSNTMLNAEIIVVVYSSPWFKCTHVYTYYKYISASKS